MEQEQKEIDIIIPKSKLLTKHSGIVLKEETIKYWDREHINEIINKITNPKDKMLIYILWRTGLRITEIINIKKQDIDFTKYIMQVRYLKSRKYQKECRKRTDGIRGDTERTSVSMANKSWTKRVRVSPKGKLLVRKPGGNHFNAGEKRSMQLDRKRMGNTITLNAKKTGRFLKG